MKPGVMATQHFKRNLLLNLYREGKKYCWLVSSCRLREIKMPGICSIVPLFGDPLAFLPGTLSSPPFLLGELCCLGKRGFVLIPQLNYLRSFCKKVISVMDIINHLLILLFCKFQLQRSCLLKYMYICSCI